MFIRLSKAFDLIIRNLLVGKLEVYGVAGISLQLMRSCLKKQQQRINGNSSLSEWETVLSGVTQGSILGPLFFNFFFLNDLFLVVTHSYLSNYVDDNTLSCFGNNKNGVKVKLKIDLAQTMEQLNEKYMVFIADKS